MFQLSLDYKNTTEDLSSTELNYNHDQNDHVLETNNISPNKKQIAISKTLSELSLSSITELIHGFNKNKDIDCSQNDLSDKQLVVVKLLLWKRSEW